MRSELVGRERELAALDARLTAALGRDARLVLCRGGPGIGKTRLAEEVVARAAARGVPAGWGRAVDTDGAPPYRPWRQIMHAVPDVSRIAGRLGVAAELDVLAAGRAVLVGRGGEDRFRLFDAVTRVLRAAAEPAGFLVVLDDAERADPASLLLLGHLAGELRGSRLLVLATDGGGLAGLAGEPSVERLELSGLGVDAVAALLPGGPVDAAHVHALTGGNPFLVEELARHLADGRPLGVPSGVRDAVASRMARLSPRCRHLLRAAAVVGRQFPVAVVAATVTRPVLECLDPLDEAAAAGLLEPADVPGEYRFVHALVRVTARRSAQPDRGVGGAAPEYGIE